MKKLLLTTILLVTVTNVFSQQEECGTPYTEPPQWVLSETGTKSPSEYENRIYMINVHTVILQTNTGEGLPISAGRTVLARLNNFYNRYGIYFGARETTIIKDDYYAVNYNNDKALSIKSKYGKNDEITIILLNSQANTHYAGIAGDIRSNYFSVGYEYYNASTVEHEMGHCLGLYHTHQGTAAAHTPLKEMYLCLRTKT